MKDGPRTGRCLLALFTVLLLCLGCRSGQEVLPVVQHTEYEFNGRTRVIMKTVDYEIPSEGCVLRFALDKYDVVRSPVYARGRCFFYTNDNEYRVEWGMRVNNSDRNFSWTIYPANDDSFPREGLVGDWYDVRYDESAQEFICRFRPNNSRGQRTVRIEYDVYLRYGYVINYGRICMRQKGR